VGEQHPHCYPALLLSAIDSVSVYLLRSNFWCKSLDEMSIIQGYDAFLNEL
jgi:hypothetical protein